MKIMIYLVFLEMHTDYGMPIPELINIERNMQALQEAQGVGSLNSKIGV